MLLFADFFPVETTWNHIQAAQILMETYGIPLRYYVDSLRIFRFIQGRDSVWRKHFLQTDEADPQWKRTMQVLGVEVIHALSPQAKGKIERPYGWMQPRAGQARGPHRAHLRPGGDRRHRGRQGRPTRRT